MANGLTERRPQIIEAKLTVLKIRPAEGCFTAQSRRDGV